MEAFDPVPPEWTLPAVHAAGFECPICHASSKAATKVWVNRRSPVFTEDHRRKWQEFYYCTCEAVWWAWSSDRPPSELTNQEREIPSPQRFFNPFEE
jgi:hypothetical protein